MISALRSAGVEVVEHHEPVFEARRDNWAVRWTVALRLFLAELRLRYSNHDAFDVVLVGYPGHFDVPHARRVAGKRPLVFNPLISLHDTLVGDRSRFRRRAVHGARPLGRRPPGAAALRPRRRRHRRQRRLPRRARRAPARARAGLPGRRRGPPLPRGLAAGRAVPRPLRRQADPVARAWRRSSRRRGSLRSSRCA